MHLEQSMMFEIRINNNVRWKWVIALWQKMKTVVCVQWTRSGWNQTNHKTHYVQIIESVWVCRDGYIRHFFELPLKTRMNASPCAISIKAVHWLYPRHPCGWRMRVSLMNGLCSSSLAFVFRLINRSCSNCEIDETSNETYSCCFVTLDVLINNSTWNSQINEEDWTLRWVAWIHSQMREKEKKTKTIGIPLNREIYFSIMLMY